MFGRGGGGGGGGGGNFFGNLFGGPGGPGGGQPFQGGGIGGVNRFDAQYQCFPVSFAGRDELEVGNKILLPPSALDHLTRMNIQWPMMFELSNVSSSRNRTHCGVLEFVADEGTCYIPYWMMQNLCLSEGGMIRVLNTTLPKGSFVKLQPVTSAFLDIHNPKAVLENTLRHFATLTVGDVICITYNSKRYEIEIIECKPAKAISIVETDVNVDFAPPKDYVEPQYKTSPASSVQHADQSSGAGGDFVMKESPDNSDDVASEQPEKSRLFGGAGQRIDGKAIKNPPVGSEPSASPRESEDEGDEMPWMHKRIPGGVKVDKPYGYGEGHMTGRPGYKGPAGSDGGGGKRGSDDVNMPGGAASLFGGKGQSLEG